MEEKNKPYVKQFNSFGEVINPITEVYRPRLPNRKARRQHLQKPKYYGLFVQRIRMSKSEVRTIIHKTVINNTKN